MSHADPKHRLCLNTSVLADCVQSKYKLTPEEFVVVLIVMSTDFSIRCISGIPGWGDIVRLCAAFLRNSNVNVVKDGVLDMPTFMRMLHSVSLYKKASKVLLQTAEDKKRVMWVTAYWNLNKDSNNVVN